MAATTSRSSAAARSACGWPPNCTAGEGARSCWNGAASLVRTAAGIDFAGTPDTWRTILGDVDLTDPPPAPALSLNEPGGSMYMIAIGGGRYRIATIDYATLGDPLDAPATFDELQA